jgi:hypothetical protein
VLREPPANARAQAAIQQVRRAWLGRLDAAPLAAAASGGADGAAVAFDVFAPGTARSTRTPAAIDAARREPPPQRTRPAPAAGALPRPEAPRADPAAAARIGTPAARRPSGADVALAVKRRATRTPLGMIVLGALVLAALFALWRTPAARPSPSPALVRSRPLPPATPRSGPLDAIDPDLRQAIQTTLADYAHALESADERLLGRVRPDLGEAERSRAITPFVGALNAATDLRVLDVVVRGAEAEVPVLRTNVIVRAGGQGGSDDPIQETLRFERRDGVWALR